MAYSRVKRIVDLLLHFNVRKTFYLWPQTNVRRNFDGLPHTSDRRYSHTSFHGVTWKFNICFYFRARVPWTSRVGGSWATSIHARKLKFGTHVKNQIYHDNPWCQGWSHPSRPQSWTINVLQVLTSRMGYTFNYVREPKLGTQLKNHISWWSMMSKCQNVKIPKYQNVRNFYCCNVKKCVLVIF